MRTCPGRALHDPTRPPAASEEFPGTFGDAKDLCGIGSRKKVAQIVGAKSTRPEAIARAVAEGYKPRLKKQAYRGCLAGLR